MRILRNHSSGQHDDNRIATRGGGAGRGVLLPGEGVDEDNFQEKVVAAAES